MTLRRVRRYGLKIEFIDEKGRRWRLIWQPDRRRFGEPAMLFNPGTKYERWADGGLFAPPLADFEALLNDRDRATLMRESIKARR